MTVPTATLTSNTAARRETTLLSHGLFRLSRICKASTNSSLGIYSNSETSYPILCPSIYETNLNVSSRDKSIKEIQKSKTHNA
jgi:hypothetical protein